MDYETFKNAAVSSLRKYFGEDADVCLQTIVKNNNVCLDGLTVQDDSVNLSPTIYLNYYYEDYLAGKPLSSVLDDMIAAHRNHLPAHSADLTFFTDYEKVKYRIIYKLIHYEKNRQLLTDVPHFRFLDLAAVFCCYLSGLPMGNASILIHSRHLSYWNATADLLYELAVKNTPLLLPFDIRRIDDVLKGLCPNWKPVMPEENEAPSFMYVLSNTERLYGASALLYPDVLARFADSIGQDLYILPSSIHETLLIPKMPQADASGLSSIVQEINNAHVLAEEVLSDHVYFFDRASGIIQM